MPYVGPNVTAKDRRRRRKFEAALAKATRATEEKLARGEPDELVPGLFTEESVCQ
jgi:hypothetical protein